MTDDRKSTAATSEKAANGGHRGQFQPGNPGRRRGARNHVTRAIEALLDGEHEALTRTAIDKALEGDMVALRLCLDRLAPPRRDAPISFEMPPVRSAEQAVDASAALLEAVAAGDVTPVEAGRVMALLTAHRAIIETADLAERLAILEAAHTKTGQRR